MNFQIDCIKMVLFQMGFLPLSPSLFLVMLKYSLENIEISLT